MPLFDEPEKSEADVFKPAPDPALPQSTAKVHGGNTLTVCVDAAKLLFPEYVKDPTGVDRDVTAAAQRVADSVLKTVLASAPEPDREIVLICVGSPGSGKTATLASASDLAVGLKIEETLDDLDRARQLVRDIIASGRKPVILWLYVDDFGKIVERMFRRALKIGRTDQLEHMMAAYKEVPEVLERLRCEFSDCLKIHVVDNSGEKGEQEFVQDSSRIWSPFEDAITTAVGMAQVDATNRMFRENPDFEVTY